MMTSCTQTPSYKITGDIANVDGIIYLIHALDGKQVIADSTKLVDGKFTFTGSVNGPQRYRLTFQNDKRANIQFLIENSDIHITADVKDSESTVITGSASQNVMKIYEDAMKPFIKKAGILNQAYMEAVKNQDSAKKEKLLAEFSELRNAVVETSLSFIKDNNKSYSAAVVASKQVGDDADQIDDLVALLDVSLMNNDLVMGMKKKAETLRSVMVGKKAPDFVLFNPEGKAVKLSTLLGKGVLLVDFWASWCGPCRKENPNVVAAYNKYHEKGFDVIGVSLDRDKADEWKKAILADHLTWAQVIDFTDGKTEVSENYAVSSIPTNFLLDKEGKIIAKNLRGEALTKKLSLLLN